MKYMTPLSLMIVAVFAFALSGCGSNTAEPTGSNTPADDDGHGEHGDGDHGHDQVDQAKIEVNLAKLSADDRALAEKQKNCPVTEEPLGAMGMPIKLDVKGQTVFICCKGCQADLEKEPDEFLGKLKDHGDAHKDHE